MPLLFGVMAAVVRLQALSSIQELSSLHGVATASTSRLIVDKLSERQRRGVFMMLILDGRQVMRRLQCYGKRIMLILAALKFVGILVSVMPN